MWETCIRWSCSMGRQFETQARGRIADCCFFLQLQSSVKNVFIRGSVVRYVHLPANAVDTPLLEDATRRGAHTVPKSRTEACLLIFRTQRLHRLPTRLSRAPHDLRNCICRLARCQIRPRDEPLYDETRMTWLATPTGCTLGASNGADKRIERQRRYALSANRERVPSMIIPSSGFLDPSCLVVSPLDSLHRSARIPQSSDNELKKYNLTAVQSQRQSLTRKGRGETCKASLSMST
jgi:hypothetical protein